MTPNERADAARAAFRSGANCSQAVTLAFADVLEEEGVTPELAERLSSPFGGGMGRMREVCGAVSGMLMILGATEGYVRSEGDGAKALLYAHVQELANAFKDEHGSIICRELLGLEDGPSSPSPTPRSESFYATRPCMELCASAARILSEYLGR